MAAIVANSAACTLMLMKGYNLNQIYKAFAIFSAFSVLTMLFVSEGG
jgi:hypothetical protein